MRKKSLICTFLFTFLILSIAFLAFAISPYVLPDDAIEQAAAEAVMPTIRTANVEVLRGKYFTVDIILENNTIGLTSLQLGIDYDRYAMTLVSVQRGQALLQLGLTQSNDITTAPYEILWNGQDPDYSVGVIATLRFKCVSSANQAILGSHPLRLTYDEGNTFRTNPRPDVDKEIHVGGEIIYQQVNLVPGALEIVEGKFKCTYYDWDGREIIHYEENEFSEFAPLEPAHPARASTRTHYYTYEQDMWEGENPWAQGDMKEPDEGFDWRIDALYNAHPQPYTVYYYFGEKDPETGIITIAENENFYYYTLQDDGVTKNYREPVNSKFDEELPLIARYTENYYSVSDWYTDIDFDPDHKFNGGTIPEDTSVDDATVAALPVGEAAPIGTFKFNLYAYRQRNEDIVSPDGVDTMISELEHVVKVEGPTEITEGDPSVILVTVDLELTKNFGIMSMTIALDYDPRLTLIDVARKDDTYWGTDTPKDKTKTPFEIFYTTNEYTEEGLAREIFRLCWENDSGNCYFQGVIATLTFTLPADAAEDSYRISVTYREKQDLTRYYDETTIAEGDDPVPAMLWYTNLNVREGFAIVREVTAPTAHEGTYTFNKTEQTYTFANNGDLTEYDLTTSDKRTDHGSQTVKVALKKEDNVYRFWKDADRSRDDLSFTFEILKKSVAIPTASTATYTYNHAEQTYVFANAGDSGYYNTAKGDTFYRDVVGTNTIICSLDDPSNSYWGEDEEDLDDKEYPFTILPLRVAKPVSAGDTYTYDTTEQTYRFSDKGGTAYYSLIEGSSEKRTASGQQEVTYRLNDVVNYCWDEAGDPQGDVSFTFIIAKRSIKAPTETALTYVYSGSLKTYVFASEEQENPTRYYSVTGKTKTYVPDDTKVKIELLHKQDTYWGDDEEDVADIYYDFVIEKQPVTPPTATTDSYTFSIDTTTYQPLTKTYSFAAQDGDTSLYDLTGEDRVIEEGVTYFRKSASGTTYITASLKDTDNYCWSTTGDSASIDYSFYVAKKAITKPTPNPSVSYVYSGEELTFVLANISGRVYYTTANMTHTDAGTYAGENAVAITLRYPADTYWADSETSETVRYDFTIEPKQIARPTRHKGVYYYTGSEQEYTFGDEGGSAFYTVSGNKRTLAGSQTVTVTLNNEAGKTNFAWEKEGEESVHSNPLTFIFEIKKKPLQQVTLKDKVEYIYTGSPISAVYNINNLLTDLYTIENDTHTNVGEYTITVTLNDGSNYCWQGTESSEPLSILFVIKKRVITAPVGLNYQTTKTVTYEKDTYWKFDFSVFDNAALQSGYFTCSTNSFTDAGSHSIVCSLNPVHAGNIRWSSGEEDVADKVFTLKIDQQVVDIPSSIPDYVYDGSPKTSGLESTEQYTVTDEGHVDAGTYTATLTLTSANYKWAQNEADPYSFTYKIKGATDNVIYDVVGSGWVYGETPSTFSASAKYGEVQITFIYPDDPTPHDSLPDNPDAGVYSVRYYVPENPNENYNEALFAKSFRIEKATMDLSHLSWVYDEEQPFTYNGCHQTVFVDGLPELFTTKPELFYVEYELRQGESIVQTTKDVGQYTSSVTIHYEEKNFNAPVTEEDFYYYCHYEIIPYEVDVVWTIEDGYEFTAQELALPTAKYVSLDLDEHEEIIEVNLVVTEAEDKTFLSSGAYRFEVEITDPNYTAKTATDLFRERTVSKKMIVAPAPHDDEAVPYVYDGSVKTYTFAANSFDADWMVVNESDIKRIPAGSQPISVTLLYPSDTYWQGADPTAVQTAKPYTFTIEKAEVIAPTRTALTYTFSGEKQTYVFASEEGDPTKYTVEHNERTEHGTQNVRVALTDPDNYRWAGTDSSEEIEYPFTIGKKKVVAPTIDPDASYQYDGTEKTYTFKTAGDASFYNVTGLKQTQAGSTTVTVTLKYPDDSYWEYDNPDATPRAKLFPFVIEKADVVAPTETALTYTFNGAKQTYVFASEEGDPTKYTVEHNERTESGTETVVVSLKYPDNYRWAGTDSSDNILFTFVIAKAVVSLPKADPSVFVYDGNEKSYCFADESFDSDWMVVNASDLKRDAAGSQSISVTLKYPSDTYWADADPTATQTARSYLFAIAKAEVTPPSATTDTYVYTGAEQRYRFSALGQEDLYSLSGDTMTDAGSGTVRVSLKDASNYRWIGTESSSPIDYPFSISPAKVTKPARDDTAFLCNGKEQTYTVAPSTLYTVSGATKQAYGTTYVVISLADKKNYVWDNSPDADNNADLLYPFTINHDFKNHYVRDEYKAGDADCTHSATYYLVCDCGEKSADTYPVGDPIGHNYTLTFEWIKHIDADGVENYDEEIYVSISCSREDYADRVLVPVTKIVVQPGKANGSIEYIASIELDGKTYTDSRKVVLKAIYHNYGEPEWSWISMEDGSISSIAVFPCIDEDALELKESVVADIAVAANEEDPDTFVCVATVNFHGVEYQAISAPQKKPVLRFISDDEEKSSVSLLPGSLINEFIPDVALDLLLKWWDEEHGVSLVYGNKGYTSFAIGYQDCTFVALWKSIGQIKVVVTDAEGLGFAGCEVEVNGEKKVVGESGEVTFDNLEYGNYSVVVTYTNGTTVIYTTGTVLGSREKIVPVQMQEKRFNTKVEDNGKNVTVENLENTVSDEDKQQIVTTGQADDVTEITVVLSVVDTEDDVKADMQEKLKKQDNEAVELSYITLVKTVTVIDQSGEEASTDTTMDSSDVLVSITFPITEEIYDALAKVHGSLENVAVAKQDGSEVGFMTKYSESVALNSEEECFYIAEQDGVQYVVVRTKSFSTTYGICVSNTETSYSLQPNEITIEIPDQWKYGEEITPTVTAQHGQENVVVFYRSNEDDEEYKTYAELPTMPGKYVIIAYVEGTDVYEGATAQKEFEILPGVNPSIDKVVFNDQTFVYDGNEHSLTVEGLPFDATVTYEGNAQVEKGEYIVTAIIDFGPEYETLTLTATLKITDAEDKASELCCIFFWILLAIAIILLILLILLLVQGRKYKRELKKEQEKQDAITPAMCVCALGKTACMTLNICLLVLDVILLGLVIWRFLANRKDKKALEQLREENATLEKPSEGTDKGEETENADAENAPDQNNGNE